VSYHYHAKMGVLILALVTFLPVTGIYIYNRKLVMKWDTSLLLKIKQLHKIPGYFMIAISQVQIFSGIWMCTHVHNAGHGMGIGSLSLFYGFLIIVEIVH
jgi:hypothetical protein